MFLMRADIAIMIEPQLFSACLETCFETVYQGFIDTWCGAMIILSCFVTHISFVFA